MISLDVARRLAQALKPARPDVAETSGGVVTRVDNDGTVWVQLHGADEDTPCTSQTAAVHVGDAVTVTIDGGSARVDGNVTRPATDDERADEAHELAAQAVEDVRTSSAQAARSIGIVGGIAEQARAVADAIGQHFFVDTNGVHVTEAEGDPTSEHNILINSLGILLRKATYPLVSITQSAIAFYDGLGSAAANVVARFGAGGSQVGRDGAAHTTVTDRAVSMVDANGGAYARMDTTDPTTVRTFTFTGNGSTKTFTIASASQPTTDGKAPSCSVTVDGVPVTDGVKFRWTANYVSLVAVEVKVQGVTFDVAPASGAAIVLSVAWGHKRGFVFGVASNATGATGDCAVGEGYLPTASANASHAEGVQCVASGFAAHAEGHATLAEQPYSHAEGDGSEAAGESAHAEGYKCMAEEADAHAQNTMTVAGSPSQTAIGKYNVADYAGTYALIVGNGTSNNARSNALAVRWDGTVETAKPLPVASGGTGSDSFGTVLTDDISTAVSVPNGSWKSLGSVTLAAGDWIVSYNAYFASNATGRRGMLLHTTADTTSTNNLRQGGVEVMAVNGGNTMLNGCRVLHITASSQTWYLNVLQTSGAALNATGYIRAFRLT